MIKRSGGRVIDANKPPPANLPYKWTVLTVQRELSKPLTSITKTIKEAYSRGWNILDHKFVTTALSKNEILDPEHSKLDVSMLANTLVCRSLHTITPVTIEEAYFKKGPSFLSKVKKRMKEVNQMEDPDAENTTPWVCVDISAVERSRKTSDSLLPICSGVDARNSAPVQICLLRWKSSVQNGRSVIPQHRTKSKI